MVHGQPIFWEFPLRISADQKSGGLPPLETGWPVSLPCKVLKIVKQGQKHKSIANAAYVEKFIEWITSFNKWRNKLLCKCSMKHTGNRTYGLYAIA